MMTFKPIGFIHSPFTEATGTPIQAAFGEEVEGTVELEEKFEPALLDLDGFDRIWLIYWLDRVGGYRPMVVPYLDDKPHGLFATRSPCRPNPIGLSAVRLLGREGRVLRIAGLDILDNTPLLDLKPYVPEFDAFVDARAGWFTQSQVQRRHADERFHRKQMSMNTATEFVSDRSIQGVCTGEEFLLDLSHGCIESAAKKAREKLVALCLEDHGREQEAPRTIELLGDFLQQTDFRTLRSSDEDLCGHRPCRVRIYRKSDGSVGWQKLAGS